MLPDRSPPCLLDLPFSGVSCFVLSLCWLLRQQVSQAPWLPREGKISIHGLFPFCWRVEEMQMPTAQKFQYEHYGRTCLGTYLVQRKPLLHRKPIPPMQTAPRPQTLPPSTTKNPSPQTSDPITDNSRSQGFQDSKPGSFIATSDCDSLGSPYVPSLTSMALTARDVSFDIKCGTDYSDPDADFLDRCRLHVSFEDCIAACASFNKVRFLLHTSS